MYDSPLLECLTPFFVEALEDSTESPEAVVAALADRIYRVCHCREPLRTRALGRDRAREREYVNALSGANGGTGPWHTAWIARGVEGDGRVEVESGGLRLWADPDDVRGTVTVGGEVRVHFPNEYRNISPGYYVVLGNADTGEHAGQIRLYWNLVPSVGPLIVERISACLNVADIGFRLKLLKDPSHASRTDAGVLYLPFSHLERALPLLREVYHEVRDHLHPPVSAFVHRVAAGLGLAEDMTDGTSFGVHRSQLLAHIVIAARGHAAPQARTVALLHAAGHDPDRFFVNAGSAREYPTW